MLKLGEDRLAQDEHQHAAAITASDFVLLALILVVLVYVLPKQLLGCWRRYRLPVNSKRQ